MFFPIGWPRVLKVLEPEKVLAIICNRNKMLFGILAVDAMSIWYCKPCVPIAFTKRSYECLQKYGKNLIFHWRPDSTMIIVATTESYLLFYKILDKSNEVRKPYQQKNSSASNLKEDNTDLYMKEPIPSIELKLDKCVWIDGGISSFTCIRDELMISTKTCMVYRHKWNGIQNRDYTLDLRRIPFSIDQQMSTLATPLTDNTFIVAIEYSPLIGGFSVVLSNGKAAFLTAHSLKFDPNQVQGIWAKDLEDATCTAVNHKYRLIAFGRKNAQATVLYVDETSGSLELSHNLILSTKDYPGILGSVSCLCWTPDSCAIAMAWYGGGVAIWSTFGALLLCTLKWDFGLNVDLIQGNPFHIITMEWSAEGYQLWMLKDFLVSKERASRNKYFQMRSVLQWEFVKSPLTVNPCMSSSGHIYLQGEDRLYINLSHKIFLNSTKVQFPHGERTDGLCHVLSGTKQWLIIPIPKTYTVCNWPLRFTAMDEEGQSIAVAGKTGLAHYSLLSRKWKLFGNEYQEKDFIVTGGFLWYHGYLITSSYSIPDNSDEIRLYPRDLRLDNNYVKSIKMSSQILLLSILKNILLIYCANSQIRMYKMILKKTKGQNWIELNMIQIIDISNLCPHPACVVSVNLTLIKSEITDNKIYPETLLLNISGKLLMIQKDHWLENAESLFTCTAPIILASNVENVWIPSITKEDQSHLTETIWLFCGNQGMKVWLPLFPKSYQDKVHTFMSKRIMLAFYLKIYPLAILFEDAILLGAENDTLLYTSDTSSPFNLPFSVLELTSQVYLHQILRQLIQRNLGYHAWEIARSCSLLPYFSHSLELLLHEVLEDEATSKEPLPDAQLPYIVEFIQEFPGFWTRAIVQCARKTEIALWPYLFSIVGPPKKLLQTCLNQEQLDTAASYLLILQNLETSSVSRQYATILLDAALEQGKWELSKDLVRFLRAIDPNDVDTFKTSVTSKIPASNSRLSSEEDNYTLILGTMQFSRNRSYSTIVAPKYINETCFRDHSKSSVILDEKIKQTNRKKSVPIFSKNNVSKNRDSSVEDFFIDVILQRHARRLLSSRRLYDLGCFAAQLDFYLVVWMARERDRAAKVDDYISAIKAIHDQFTYPYPEFYFDENTQLKNGRRDSPILDICLQQDLKKGSESTSYDIETPDSGYTSSLSNKQYMQRSLADSSLNVQFIKDSNNERLKNFETHNDSNSFTSDISNLMWPDNTEIIIDNNYESTCWAATNIIEATEVTGYLFNHHTIRTEIQLRYLLQLFLEAGCLGWAAVISIVLRDVSAIAQTIRAAHAPMQTVESASNLKDGLLKLIDWSHLECLGYKQFLTNIQGQILLLQRLIKDKQKNKLEYVKLKEHDQLLNHNICSSTNLNLKENMVHTVSSVATCNNETLKKYSWINDEYSLHQNNEDVNVSSSDSICTLS